MPHLVALYLSAYDWDVFVIDSIDTIARKQRRRAQDSFGQPLPRFIRARVIENAVDGNSLQRHSWYDRKMEATGRRSVFTSLAKALPVVDFENLG